MCRHVNWIKICSDCGDILEDTDNKESTKTITAGSFGETNTIYDEIQLWDRLSDEGLLLTSRAPEQG